MADIGSSFSKVTSTATISGATTPAIYNVSAPTANTEVSQALSSNTKQFMIKNRGNAKMQVAFTATESGSKYITVPPGSGLHCDTLDFSGTIYFQTDKNSQTVEILEWS